jgi:outer membrane protein assembly factor BamE (lipoprotein component of BamABCDE complex)
MKTKLTMMAAALSLSAATFAHDVPQLNAATIAKIKPGATTKAGVQSLLGSPWRIAQFNDCGHAPPGQADETWDYRGTEASGSYRLHIEFDDRGVARLIAKIPDHVPGGAGTAATIAPADRSGEKMAMKM